MSFIEWCNINQGFLSFVLSFLTFITSIIAIILALKSYLKEYKKELSIHSSILVDESEYNNLFVKIINTGNKSLEIENVYIMYDNFHISCNCNKNYRSKILAPSESISLEFALNRFYVEVFKSLVDKHSYNKFTKHFKLYVVDSTGNKFYCKEFIPAI